MNGITHREWARCVVLSAKLRSLTWRADGFTWKKLLALPTVTTVHTEKFERGLQLP